MHSINGYDTFYAYWDQLRGGETLPRKKNFDPLAVKSLLSQMSVFEIRARDDLHVRLIGSSLIEQGKAHQTGMNQFHFIPSFQHDLMSRVLDDIIDTPCLVSFSTDRVFDEGRVVATKGVSFPFLDENNNPRFTIVVFEVDKKAMRHLDGANELQKVEYTFIDFDDVGLGVPPWMYDGTSLVERKFCRD